MSRVRILSNNFYSFRVGHIEVSNFHFCIWEKFFFFLNTLLLSFEIFRFRSIFVHSLVFHLNDHNRFFFFSIFFKSVAQWIVIQVIHDYLKTNKAPRLGSREKKIFKTQNGFVTYEIRPAKFSGERGKTNHHRHTSLPLVSPPLCRNPRAPSSQSWSLVVSAVKEPREPISMTRTNLIFFFLHPKIFFRSFFPFFFESTPSPLPLKTLTKFLVFYFFNLFSLDSGLTGWYNIMLS